MPRCRPVERVLACSRRPPQRLLAPRDDRFNQTELRPVFNQQHQPTFQFASQQCESPIGSHWLQIASVHPLATRPGWVGQAGTVLQAWKCPRVPWLCLARFARFSVAMVKRLSYRSDLQSIYSQNMLGIKTDVSMCELHGCSRARDAFAVCGQETWRCGADRAWVLTLER